MHTVLDVITGLVLAILMMIPLVPLVDAMDYYFLTNSWALLALVVITILTIIYYPCSDKWTPTRYGCDNLFHINAKLIFYNIYAFIEETPLLWFL